MIELTAWSGEKFYLNPDMIVRIDERPDTVITLTDGTPIIVKDTAKEFISKYGKDRLKEVCKVHFKTYNEV